MPRSARSAGATQHPTRFGWGMRLFLTLFLFDMVVRSLSVSWPWPDWLEKLEMQRLPRPLPTQAEVRAHLRGEVEPNCPTLGEEILLSMDSVWHFFQPWPDAATRPRLTGKRELGRWMLAWLASRLEFCENVVGINQEWPMFSPSVSKEKRVARARLTFSDGSQYTVRGHCDPPDLTRYSHWFQEKILDYELKIQEGAGFQAQDNLGYCNLLAHRYPRNEQQASLRSVSLFMVRYQLPPPRANASDWLRAQSGPPADQVLADFYLYDVPSRKGRVLRDSYE